MRTVAMCAAATILLAFARTAAAQESLLAARHLYSAAAYEDALALLNRLRESAHRATDNRYIEQYRAFCLLALGRTAEAERAIAAVVTVAPAYRPSATDASPSVRSAFRDVRRRMLPGIIQQKYASAKAAFFRKDLATARAGFKQVLELLADPDIAQAASVPPLSEMRTLATGFRDLSSPMPPARPAPARPQPPRIYGLSDAGVVPPMAIRQSLPPLADVIAPRPGILEIVIDEAGEVESARMRASVNAAYDRHVIATARSWRYWPARFRGAPVKYRKIIQIKVRGAR